MKKVLISDNLSPEGLDIFKKAGIEVDARAKTSAEELKAIIADYTLDRPQRHEGPAEYWNWARSSQSARAGVGLDNVDIEADETGIG
jgi:D-3-phosphoglycerate dehydrogenase